ncbi:DUF2624 family protein [Scopulibacillus cellulosilyticus]|uniref:DUF2624 family protein n=1 Tax=Scopulibacillus cellulosilyticus TaxID=2665665 RepID=A0ABW2PVE5_9BACL
MIRQFVNQKINHITPQELLQLSQQYGFDLSRTQAEKISKLLRGKNIDIFNDRDRHQVLQNVSQNIDANLATEINRMFNEFM